MEGFDGFFNHLSMVMVDGNDGKFVHMFFVLKAKMCRCIHQINRGLFSLPVRIKIKIPVLCESNFTTGIFD
jgi:hypothetical protein